MKFPLFLFLSSLVCSPILLAQSSGQSTTVNIGVIESTEEVTLQYTGQDSGKGAIAGAVIGYNAGSGHSSSKKRRRAMIGGAVGSAAGASGTTPGMEYAVKLDNGESVLVVSDQTHLKVGDCVSVERARDMANIREQDPAACDPAASEAVSDLKDELAEDADECAEVKQQLVDAKTPEEVEMATAKAKILCN